jgi:hypothetical protein
LSLPFEPENSSPEVHIMRGWRGRYSVRAAQAGLVALVCWAISGCGGRTTATVTGTVTLDGKPVPAGTVSFFASDQDPVSVPISSDGTYTATDVPTGPVKVAVLTPLAPSERVAGATQMKRRFGRGKPMPSTINVVSVPTKYSDPARSGLGLDVNAGSQPYDIKLKKE